MRNKKKSVSEIFLVKVWVLTAAIQCCTHSLTNWVHFYFWIYFKITIGSLLYTITDDADHTPKTTKNNTAARKFSLNNFFVFSFYSFIHSFFFSQYVLLFGSVQFMIIMFLFPCFDSLLFCVPSNKRS